jgi:MFS family permease
MPELTATLPRRAGDRPAGEKLLSREYVRILLIHFLAMGSVSTYFFLPRFIRYTGGDEFLIGLIMGAPAGAAVLLRLPTGRWIDRIGKRRLITLGLFLFSLASALPLFATRGGFYLMLARALAGASSVLYFTASVTYVADKAPAGRRAEAIAVYGAAGFVAQAMLPYFCEWLLTVLPFETLVRYRVLFGLAALSASLAAAVSLTLGRDVEYGRPRLAPDPLFRVLSSRTMLYLIVPSLFFGAGYASMFNFVTDFTQVSRIGSPSWFFISYSLVIILLRLTTGRLLDRVDRRLGVVLALASLSAGLFYASIASKPADMLVVGMLTGIGHCYIFPTLSSLTYDSSPVRNRGTSMALYMLGFDVSGMALSPVFGRMAQAWNYAVMYRFSAVLIAVGLLLYTTGWRHHAPAAVIRHAGEDSADMFAGNAG